MNKSTLKQKIKLFLSFLPDRAYIKLYFKKNLHRKLDLNEPKTLNEKLQWMKFNYRNPLYSIVSDKYAVREYVKEKIGEEYLIPLYGSWDRVEDVNIESLPNSFVLKCNHDSGGLCICKDKSKLNWKKSKKALNKSLKINFYNIGREYQYNAIKRKIICEKFIGEDDNVPDDYKIYCFNGKPYVILLCKDRFSTGSHRAKYLFFSKDWEFLRLDKGDEKLEIPNIPKPENLDKMFEIAEILSKDFIFARIDLYNIKGKIYFGEITLSPNAGFDADLTYETDLDFGNRLEIPYWNQINHKI